MVLSWSKAGRGTPAATMREVGRALHTSRPRRAHKVGNAEAPERPPHRGIVTLDARERPDHAWPHAATRCHTLPCTVRFLVTRIRRGGYIFVTWSGDHEPRHVHVYRNGRLLAKGDLERWRAIWGTPAPAVVSIIRDLRREGRV